MCIQRYRKACNAKRFQNDKTVNSNLFELRKENNVSAFPFYRYTWIVQPILADRFRARKNDDWRLEETLGAETRASRRARDARALNFGLGRRDAKNV